MKSTYFARNIFTPNVLFILYEIKVGEDDEKLKIIFIFRKRKLFYFYQRLTKESFSNCNSWQLTYLEKYGGTYYYYLHLRLTVFRYKNHPFCRNIGCALTWIQSNLHYISKKILLFKVVNTCTALSNDAVIDLIRNILLIHTSTS